MIGAAVQRAIREEEPRTDRRAVLQIPGGRFSQSRRPAFGQGARLVRGNGEGDVYST